MCGINGIINYNKNPDEQRVRKMNQIIADRGPDNEGYYIKGPCILGHRRLSIIDLTSNGNQPMVKDAHGLAIIFNGEIYNYKIIKEELQEKGYKFKTNSDTEVILFGFDYWGIENLCKKLSGMFAFAIWDEKKNQLNIARDRFGEKPFYFYYDGTEFCFSSVATAISKTADKKFNLNELGLFSYFQLGYCLPQYHIFNEIQSLEPASFGILSSNNFVSQKYWDFDCNENKDFNNWENQLSGLLKNAVSSQLVSDVPIGCLLSGGVDSTLISSFASELNPNLKLFTAKMKNSKLDESVLAKKIAKEIGGKHYLIEADPLSESDFYNLMGKFSEPLGDASALGVWLISKKAKDHVKVVLTGDGGDEFFAGYKTVDLHQKVNSIKKLTNSNFLKPILIRITKIIQNSKSSNQNIQKALTLLRLISTSYREYHVGKSLLPLGTPDVFANNFFNKDLEEVLLGKLFSIWDLNLKKSDLTKQLLYDIKTDLPNDYLRKVDTATMANSVESRAPFLDYKLAEFAMSLPNSIKRNNNQSKGALKTILRSRISPEIYKQIVSEKRGFVLPIDNWISNEWSNISNNLLNSDLIKDGVLNINFVQHIIKNAKINPERYSRIRYSLIALDSWYRNQIN